MRGRYMSVIGLVACCLGACGGDTSTGTTTSASARAATGEERTVRALVTKALKTTDPSACTRLFTRELVDQLTGEHGAAALNACRDDADNPGATTLTIDRVAVDGARAEADVRPRGGGLPFQTATFALRKSGGRWKLTRLQRGTLDRPAFRRELRRELSKPPDAVPKALAGCAVRDLEDASDGRIARAFINHDTQVFLVPVTLCALRDELSGGVPPDTLECVTAASGAS